MRCFSCKGTGKENWDWDEPDDTPCEVCRGSGGSGIQQIFINNKFLEIKRMIYFVFWNIAHFWMRFNPKKYIPVDTDYCYKIIGISEDQRKIHVKSCDWHKYLGWDLCMYNNSNCCYDSCKTCGHKHAPDIFTEEDARNNDIVQYQLFRTDCLEYGIPDEEIVSQEEFLDICKKIKETELPL